MAARLNRGLQHRVWTKVAIACFVPLLVSVAGQARQASAQAWSSDVDTPTTVSSSIPELSGLPEATALHITYEWYGLNPVSPITIDYPLVLKGHAFEGSAVYSEEKVLPGGLPFQRDQTGDHRVATKHKITIPQETIRAFLLSVLAAHAEEKEYVGRVDHTDDYPRLAFEIRGPKGDVLVGATSQPVTVNTHLSRAPWGVLYDNRTLVISTCEIDLALEPLSKYLWKLPTPATAFVAFPNARIPLPAC